MVYERTKKKCVDLLVIACLVSTKYRFITHVLSTKDSNCMCLWPHNTKSLHDWCNGG